MSNDTVETTLATVYALLVAIPFAVWQNSFAAGLFMFFVAWLAAMGISEIAAK